MTNRILAILAVPILFFVLSPDVRAEETRTTLWFGTPTIITDGTRMVKGDDVDRGMDLLRQALDLNLDMTSKAMALTNLCMGHIRKMEYAEAMSLCERALEMRPSQWQAVNNRGCAHFGLGDMDAAVRDFTRASMLNPDDEDIMLNLTMAIDARNKQRPPTSVN